MLTLRHAACSLAALLVTTTATAQSFDRLSWTQSRNSGNQATVLELLPTGAAELRTTYLADVVSQGLAPPVLRGQLTAAELSALEAALRSPTLQQIPSQLPNGFGGAKVLLEVEFADGRPPLRTEGVAKFLGTNGPALKTIETLADTVRARLKASDPTLRLEINRINDFPRTIYADETLEFSVSGQGQPGLAFEGLRVELSGRRLVVEAIARQVPVGPAQPFSERIRVERAGRIGHGYLHLFTSSSSSLYGTRARILQPESPQDGVFNGTVVEKKGRFLLRIDAAEGARDTLPLTAAAADEIGKFKGEVVRFKGRTVLGQLALDELVMPIKRTIVGNASIGRRVRAEGLGNVYAVGPAAEVLEKVDRGTRVLLDGYYFQDPALNLRPRRWTDTGSRSLYLAHRFYVERIQATVASEAKVKRGWRTVGKVTPGDEVWVSKRRAFGWSLDVTSADGSLSGRMRRTRLDFNQAKQLPGGPGTAGLLGGVNAAGQ